MIKLTENKKKLMLTMRESQVLNSISFGQSTDEIAKDLLLSKHTVITYRKILLRKLKAQNTAQLIRRGFELGILSTASEIGQEQ